MKTKLVTGCAALIASTFILLPAMADNTITEREKRDCRGDYHSYCSEYGLGTEALRACMSRNIKRVSNMCVAAFVDAGEMTQAQADKLRPATKTTKKTSKRTTHRHKHVASTSSKKTRH